MKSAHVAPRAHGNGQLLLKATVHWVGTQAALAQTHMLAPALIGRDAEMREAIYDDLTRPRKNTRKMKMGPYKTTAFLIGGNVDDADYNALMEGVQSFIDQPGERDVPVSQVFTPAP